MLLSIKPIPKLPTLVLVPPIPGLKEALEHCCVPIEVPKDGKLDGPLDEHGREIRILIVAGGKPDRAMLARLPNLGLIACAGAGYDGIDVAAMRSRGVQISHCPKTNHLDVADYAIGLVISTVRQIARADRIVRAGEWTRPGPLAISPSLRMLHYGIVGMGAIGCAIAERLQGFGGTLSWWGPNAKPSSPWHREASLVELARRSDVLIVAAAAVPGNRHLIDAGILEALGPNGYLVNISRGELIDEAALLSALRECAIAGAGLDVFTQEPTNASDWSAFETVTLSPHVAAFTRGAMQETLRLLTANIQNFSAGEPLLTPVP